MYSNNKSVLQLVALLKEHGIRQVVVSPGARNCPVVETIASCSFFECHSVLDERSAGFFALGLALNSCNKCVALCCTSGSAALNYAPAIAEAYHRKIGLLVVTADRPEMWIGQMDNQVIKQRDMFGNLVVKSVTLPEIKTADDEWYCNRLVNEAILELNHNIARPVHINIPLSEPLFEFTETNLPEVRVIRRDAISGGNSSKTQEAFENYGCKFNLFKRKMIITGQGYEKDCDAGLEMELLEWLYNNGCVILAEHTSNLSASPYPIYNFDAILRSIPEDLWYLYDPDLLITVGNHTVSKTIKKFLRRHKPVEHWHLAADGEIADTYQCLTDVIEQTFAGFGFGMKYSEYESESVDTTFADIWTAASRRIEEPCPAFSDLMATGELMHNISPPATLHLANSSSVRLAQLFKLEGTRVFSNRGVSGIEGCLSTAYGYAVSELPGEALVYIITGDLAFFYDSNFLFNSSAGVYKLRILLNNNGGGEIFQTLPGFEDSDVMEKYISLKHKSTAQKWAEERGIDYLTAGNEDELKAGIKILTDTTVRRPMLLEVFTEIKQNIDELNKYYNQQKI